MEELEADLNKLRVKRLRAKIERQAAQITRLEASRKGLKKRNKELQEAGMKIHVIEDDGESEKCQRCGYLVGVVWHAPDEIWKKVTGNADGSGIFCIQCFNQMAWEVDIFLYWECAEDRYPTLFPKDEGGAKI